MDIAQAREILDLACSVETHIVDDNAEAWVERLNDRVSDIAPSIETLEESGDSEAALDLAGALGIFWQDIGKVEEGPLITERLLQRLDAHPRTSALARAYLVLGELSFRQGNQAVVTEASVAAREIANQVENKWVAGRGELNLARVAFRDGDADRIFTHANSLLKMAGDNLRLQTGAIYMLAWAEYTAGNVPAAIARFEQNVQLYRQGKNRMGEASELGNLGDLSIEAGEFDRAASYLEQSFAVRGVKQNRYLALSLIRSAGVLAVFQGKHDLGLELIAA